ncbi:MAG: 4-(cytidine 5'-diphospho)-2-C-methyl-D-erythritol kinase [Bacteroides sp.]|nr:4-(cytidine 5'-diphospho)-2-C-methyl-D-erythritol kinase [Bacteroides sp.]
MITFPNAKINLGLNITEKRPDGYHNLETIFYPIPVSDALEITPLRKGDGKCLLHQSGLEIAGDPEKNLVVRAYRMLDEELGLPPVEIHLHKRLPSGAGLGGGSADAAFMLKALNETFALQLTDERLEEYAARLGADCAFFIKNRPTYAEGIGNIFSPITLSLQGYQLLLVKPDIFVSTREAFARITPRRPKVSLKEIVTLPIEQWRETMTNDFEESVFPQYPAIGAIKETLYQMGALYAAMSGSGSSVFGLFAPGAVVPPADFGDKAFVFCGRL